MRSSIGGDHARGMDHFVQDDDVARSLEDLVAVVITRGEQAPGDPTRDAPVPRTHQLGSVAAASFAVIAVTLCLRPERHATVWRVDHERRLPRRHHLGPRVEPELVVGPDVTWLGWTISVLALCVGALFDGGSLGFGQECFVGQRRRPLEGRDGFVRPRALQIGLTPRSARRCPGVALLGDQWETASKEEYAKRRSEQPSIHLRSLRKRGHTQRRSLYH
jgi:hypothetical protein